MVGYRFGEVPLAQIGPIKAGVKIGSVRDVDLNTRPVVATSLGAHAELAGVPLALPHPDPKDPLTTLAGSEKRFLTDPPAPNRALRRRFAKFVAKFIKKHFVPLAHTADTSLETWLEHTNYPEWRKAELREAIANAQNPDDAKYRIVKSFMKDETYKSYKHARAINSRHDVFKCLVGPIFKLIEHEVYQHPAFIKHVPVADRPEYIANRLCREGAIYLATDYTAFESLFTESMMEDCEFQLYEYMTQHLPEHDQFMGRVREALGGLNKCVFKNFTLRCPATRMSGEQNTSLGNGFSNLVIMHFMAEEVRGCRNVVGVVEGDDGLFSMVGEPPCPKDFEELGLNIKLEVHERISTASFCGIVFAEEDRANLCDPMQALTNFGWATQKYSGSKAHKKLQLLRCKSLSLAHQYPGCPVVQSLAQFGLRVTRKVATGLEHVVQKDRRIDVYHRDRLLTAIRDESNVKTLKVGHASRLLVEQLFGLTVQQQIDLENVLDGMNVLAPIDVTSVERAVPDVWLDYSLAYGVKTVGSHKEAVMVRPFVTPWRVLIPAED